NRNRDWRPWLTSALDELPYAPQSDVSLRAQLELAVDLDGNAVRQLGQTNSGARVLAALRAEELVEEVGGAVDHLGHAVEAGRHVDHAHQSHDALDAVELAQLLLEAREDRQRDQPRGGVALLDGEVAAELADHLDARRRTVVAAVPRHEDHRADH